MEEYKMDFDTLGEGIRIVERAAGILETISNEPGVTPTEFYNALDSLGIVDTIDRTVLAQAAATVEMTLELMSESEDSIIH
tara:strand:+ start:120 stop:362 length:243 start_codon:yes stop_codon:yes gene_type:complete